MTLTCYKLLVVLILSKNCDSLLGF